MREPLRLSYLALFGLSLAGQALAADRLTCGEVRDWLTEGDLSEDVILQRIARHLGPVQRTIVSCLADDATPRIRDALAAKLQGVAFDPSDESVYSIDVDSGTLTEDMGYTVARHVRLTWVGDLPYVVIFDDDVFETPDWFYDYRDLLTLDLVRSLPTGSMLAGDPLALGDDAQQLLGEEAAAARTRLRNAGFKRLLVVHRGRGTEDPEALVVHVEGEDLWSEDAPECSVVFVQGAGAPMPGLNTPDPVEPLEPVTRGGLKPTVSRPWFGFGLGAHGGVTLPGGTLQILGTGEAAEAQLGPAGTYPAVNADAAIRGHPRVGAELIVSGRVSVVRMEANLGISGLVGFDSVETTVDRGRVSAKIGPELEFGGLVGAGWGSRPVMAYLGWYAGGQHWFTGPATIGANNPAQIETRVPLAFVTGPAVVVDLYADRFGESARSGPPMAMSLALRGSIIGGSPYVGLAFRGLWLPLGR